LAIRVVSVSVHETAVGVCGGALYCQCLRRRVVAVTVRGPLPVALAILVDVGVEIGQIARRACGDLGLSEPTFVGVGRKMSGVGVGT
jgi:hypothetical protein